MSDELDIYALDITALTQDVARVGETLRLLETRRADVAAEIRSLVQTLTAPGMPGLLGNLDVDGFPRADLDIPFVLEKRQRYNCLNNDYTQIMKLIEALLPTALPRAD